MGDLATNIHLFVMNSNYLHKKIDASIVFMLSASNEIWR